jgi:4-amino-4-deoxy-L-arabinose transferase-like glycosyltransferase
MAGVVDAAAVFVTGLAAREAAGPRAGLIAGAIAALYPNFWVTTGTGLAETLLLLVIAAVVWATLRYRSGPSAWRALVLGLLCGLAMLVRSEQVLLVPFVLAPAMLLARGIEWRRRLATLGIAAAAAAVVVAPWVGFNLSRLSQPEYLSTELGTTLAGANCPRTYSGPLVGSWSFACALSAAGGGDEAEQDAHSRAAAERSMSAHAGRLPIVIGARLGRDLSLYRPFEGTTLGYYEGRPLWPARIGAVAFWLLAIGAAAGAVTLARARTTLLPFLGIVLEVLVVAAATYGSARLRAPLEVAVVVLSAVALDAVLVPTRPAAL